VRVSAVSVTGGSACNAASVKVIGVCTAPPTVNESLRPPVVAVGGGLALGWGETVKLHAESISTAAIRTGAAHAACRRFTAPSVLACHDRFGVH
jgi:hypothetical protein